MIKNNNGNVSILFCGDFMANNPKSIILNDDFRNILLTCDVRCISFEGPLPIGHPITIKGTAVLPQSFDSPDWCEDKGFNIISFANNHTGDFGEIGIKRTIEAFKTALVIGAGTWEEALMIKSLEINNVKIGFLSVAQCELGILNDVWMNKDALGCAWINSPGLNKKIKEAKESLDFLIVLSHAGIEYHPIPLPEWRDRYKELIDWGADAIIGGHPHVPQGWETYRGKPIFYSLGDFFFDMNHNKKYTNSSLCVILQLENNNRISHKVINLIKTGNKIMIDRSKGILDHNFEICNVLNNPKEYIEKVDEICLSLWHSYEETMLIALNCDRTSLSIKNIAKYLLHTITRRKPEYRYILNYLRCESHRFAISRALKLLTGVKV